MSKTNFVAKDGKTYVIEIDDFGEDITVLHQGQSIGTITLAQREAQDGHGTRIYYHLVNLSLDKCSGLGIGRHCLELHRQEFDAPITAENVNGPKKEDGSHLTGNGPGFVTRMRALGIVAKTDDSWDWYDQDD